MTLESRIASIERRNGKVPQDKAWEASRTRRKWDEKCVVPDK